METETLETRVKQFRALRLPGQPMGMHMGTAYLVNDLWKTVERQHEALAFAKSCIKSGEPWTEECERIIQGALDVLTAGDDLDQDLAQAMNDLRPD